MGMKTYSIRTVARLAAASPRLRRVLITLLNRAPATKRRLKQALARAHTVAAQKVAGGEEDADAALLSRQARRVLRDLLQQTSRARGRQPVAGERD